jgi:MFS family permease
MVGADLVRAATFTALPFIHAPTAIIALAAVNGVATGFFRPAVWAGLPNLVDEDDRERATSLLSTVENIAWIAGPLASAALISVWSPSLAYWANAVTFVLSAMLVAGIPARMLQASESLSRGHWSDVLEGFALVIRSRPLLTVLLVWGTAALATGCINVAEVYLAKNEDALDAGNVGYGVLVAATGVGIASGSLFASPLLGRLGMSRVYWGALALMGVGYALASQGPALWVVAVLAGIATVGNGVAIVCNQLLVQRGAQDDMRGRALALLMSLYYALLLAGMGGAAALTDLFGPRTTWLVAGGIYLSAAMIALVMTRRIREEALALLAAEPRDGVDRMERLLGEVDATRERERTRPRRALPYVPRRRTGSG